MIQDSIIEENQQEIHLEKYQQPTNKIQLQGIESSKSLDSQSTLPSSSSYEPGMSSSKRTSIQNNMMENNIYKIQTPQAFQNEFQNFSLATNSVLEQDYQQFLNTFEDNIMKWLESKQIKLVHPDPQGEYYDQKRNSLNSQIINENIQEQDSNTSSQEETIRQKSGTLLVQAPGKSPLAMRRRRQTQANLKRNLDLNAQDNNQQNINNYNKQKSYDDINQNTTENQQLINNSQITNLNLKQNDSKQIESKSNKIYSISSFLDNKFANYNNNQQKI